MASKTEPRVLEIAGREVAISNPDKVLFPRAGYTKLDLVRYYHTGSLERLLELSARQAGEGLGDAPWPPHYKKQAGEAPRVAPSKRRVSTRPLVEIDPAEDMAEDWIKPQTPSRARKGS